MKKIPLCIPHLSGMEQRYVQNAIDSNWIAPLGPDVNAFEKEMKEYVGSKGAIALSSGTAAIHMALKWVGIKEGDYVFCSSLTFAGSCNPILYEKAIPVFIDSEPNSWNMSPQALNKAFESYKKQGIVPKAVIVVNLYGQSADYDKLRTICDNYNVPIIEDAAESLGATYKGRQTGRLGDLGIFSFNGNKIITTSGGGMIVSDDLEAIEKIRFWSTQSREPFRHYEHKEVGYNYRLSNISAALGRGQLTVLDERITRKKEIYNNYRDAFEDIEAIQMMPIAEFGEPNYWLSVMTIGSERNKTVSDLIKLLDENNIETRPVWKPMHLQPLFRESDYFAHDTDVSAELFQQGLCLPSWTAMTNEEQEYVVEVIKGYFG